VNDGNAASWNQPDSDRAYRPQIVEKALLKATHCRTNRRQVSAPGLGRGEASDGLLPNVFGVASKNLPH